MLEQGTGKSSQELQELLLKSYFRKAKAYEGQKDIEKALEAIKQALKLNDRNTEVKKLETHLQVSNKKVSRSKSNSIRQ